MTLLDTRPGAPPPPVGTDDNTAAQALFKEARRRRARRRAVGAVLAFVVLMATATLAVSRQEGGPTSSARHGTPRHTAIPSVPPVPAQMVVWAQTSRNTMSIEVISSTTGRVVRRLATDDGLFDSTPQPAVSVTGTVYFDDSVPGTSTPGPGAPPPIEHIESVPLAGGTVSVIADGHDPQVSPNGVFLAYLTWTQITDAPEAVVVRNLVTGTARTWSYATDGPDINQISWSPDSESLAFATETLVGQSWRLSTRLLDLTDPGRSLELTPRITLPQCPSATPWASSDAGRDMAWAGFLNKRQGIGICHHVGLTRQGDWTQPVVVDLATGQVVRRFPVVPGLLGVGPGGGFQADPSGHYLAFIGAGLGAGGLYRWRISAGSTRRSSGPLLVRNDVGSEGWVPSTS
jgi:hypothetical protein